MTVLAGCLQRINVAVTNNSTCSAKVIDHPACKGEGILDDGGYCLIVPGDYDLAYMRHELFNMGRIVKLAVWFRVVSMGPAFQKTVPRFYNIKRIHKSGNFTLGRHSSFVTEFITLFPQKIKRFDRFPIKKSFSQVIVTGTVRTVVKDREQRKYNEFLQYSVVDKLTGVRQ